MNFLKLAMQAIFQSKKATAALAGVLLTLLSPLAHKIGWQLTGDQVASVLVILGSFIIGQGIADAGKERAKIELRYRDRPGTGLIDDSEEHTAR